MTSLWGHTLAYFSANMIKCYRIFLWSCSSCHSPSVSNIWNYFTELILILCRSQWPHGLRRRSSAARLLRLWVRIPPRAWMFVCCQCCVLSGRGLCDGLITRPEKSYRIRRRSSAARLLSSNLTGGMDVCLLSVSVSVSLRRTDHSSRGVLPTVARRCVWSWNLVSEEAKAR